MARRSNTITPEQAEKEEIAGGARLEELLTVHEVARRLRVDDTTVRRWIKNGVLEAITLPHKGKRQAYRVKQSTLEILINNPVALVEA